MSYIAFDLDALNVVPDVAAACGLPAGDVAHGLLKLWAWVFREKADIVTTTHLSGFFGNRPVADALEAFGFLSKEGEAWRVRGSERYLRVAKQRADAGKARSSSAGRSAGRFTSDTPATDQRDTSETRFPTSESPALTPSTKHLAPSTNEDVRAPPIAAFEVIAPDLESIDSWTKEDFWRAAEVTRRSMGYAPEKWPKPLVLARWWAEARGLAEVRELAEAFTRFAADKHWRARAPPAPFGGFASQWSNFLPSKGP